jgi:hypothetical protein
MNTIRDTAELLQIKKQIEALSPPERLRLAAGLIEQGKLNLAETIAGRVVDELRLKRLLASAPKVSNA